MIPRPGDMVVTRWGALYRGRRLPCAIGRGGITADKREGDGATPAGPLRLMGAGYRADHMAHPFEGRRGPFHLRPIAPADIWSDDPADPDYNHALRTPAHPFSHEKLRRGDRLYDLFVITDWNWPDATPAKGSAIFLHRWRKPRHPTEGCIAFAPAVLRWIVQTWQPGARIIVKP